MISLWERKDGKFLILSCAHVEGEGVWGVTAVETSAPSGRDLAGAADHILEDHAHKNLGIRGTMLLAIDAAEEFARQWAEGTDIEHCTCATIPTPEPMPRPPTPGPGRRED